MENMTLTGDLIVLRALEPEDLDFLYRLENDSSIWEVSNTNTPYSRYILKQYLENSHRDIYDVKQLRLMICDKKSNNAIGCIDLYDFDPKHHRVGVGIIIFSKKDRNKGYATQALKLTCSYAFDHLDVHQVFASISEDNEPSLLMFKKEGFERTGIKKDWMFSSGSYKNVYLYQLIRDVH
jgi:diamine N-acetyltransferase